MELKFNKNIWIKVFGVANHKLRLTVEGEYSITKPRDATRITQIIKQTCMQNKIHVNRIIDLTAGMGGNVLDFFNEKPFFKEIIAVENTKLHCKILKNNMTVLHKPINILHDCALHVIKNKLIQQNTIVFFDPPWGGPNYKKNILVRLKLNNMSIVEIIKNLLCNGNINLICVKLPFNYDIDEFKGLKYTRYNINNFQIIVFL